MDEENVCVYNVMKYYEAIQKEISSFAPAWTDLGGITLSEMNQTEKDKHHTISPIRGI